MAAIPSDPKSLVEAACASTMCEDLLELDELRRRADKARILLIVMSVTGAALLIAAVVLAVLRPAQRDVPPELLAGVPGLLGICLPAVFVVRHVGAKKRFETYRPRRRLRAVKVGLLPMVAIRGSAGTYVSDQAALTEPTTLTFPSEEAAKRLEKALDRHRDLVRAMPPVLSADGKKTVSVEDGERQPLFAEEALLHGNYEEAESIMDGLEASSERARLLDLTPEQLADLVQTDSAREGVWETAPVVSAQARSDEAEIRDLVRRLEGELRAVEEKDSARNQVDAFLTEFLETIESDLSTLGDHRDLSLGRLLRYYSRDLEKLSTMASYSYYCPTCNADMITDSAEGRWDSDACKFPAPDKATKMRVVAGTNLWECPVCAARTERPFPVHRLLDELLYPTMDRLLQENRVDRVKIYLEAEQHKRGIMQTAERESRAIVENAQREARLVQARVRDISSDITAAKASIGLLLAELAGIEALRRSRIGEIGREIQATVNEIASYRDRTNQAFSVSMHNIMSEATAKLTDLAEVARQEDQARMQLQQEIASNLKSMDESMKVNNALTAAMARKSGAFKTKKVIGGVMETLGDVKQAVTGESDYERERARFGK